MKTKFLIPLVVGFGLLCACKNKPSYAFVNNSADTVKTDSNIVIKPKIVKTAGMRLKVNNVQQTAEKVTALTTAYHGTVMHHLMGSTPNRTQDIRISTDSILRVTSMFTTDDITVRISVEKVEDYMNQVARLGIYVNSRRIDVTDKSLDYLSAQLKLRSRAELISQQKKGKIIIKNLANVLLLKDDMVDQQINNREIDDAVKNTVVDLHFYQSNTIYKEVIANDDPSAYHLPFIQRLGIAVEKGGRVFVNLIIAIVDMWAFILAGIGFYTAVRYYRNKKVPDTIKI